MKRTLIIPDAVRRVDCSLAVLDRWQDHEGLIAAPHKIRRAWEVFAPVWRVACQAEYDRLRQNDADFADVAPTKLAWSDAARRGMRLARRIGIRKALCRGRPSTRRPSRRAWRVFETWRAVLLRVNATVWRAQWAVLEGAPLHRVAWLHRIAPDVLVASLDAAWSALDTATRRSVGVRAPSTYATN